MASNALLRLQSQQNLVRVPKFTNSNRSNNIYNAKISETRSGKPKTKVLENDEQLSNIQMRSGQQHLQNQCNNNKNCSNLSHSVASRNQFKAWKDLRLRFNSSATLSLNNWLQVLLVACILGSNNLANGEGNIGCKFVHTLCLHNSEVCFDDNIFGKCILTTGVDVEDIEKTPLTEDQSHLLATMLEELQGAGLGWDHPYVQCRIQGTLFSMQKHTQLPPNLCANLAPIPTDIDPAGAMAFVRFTPPDDDYAAAANYLFYPPFKKNARQHQAQQQIELHSPHRSNGINTIFHKLQLQDRQLRNDPIESLATFGEFDMHRESQMNPSNVMDIFLEKERERMQKDQEEGESDLDAEHKQALRDRMELYQILAASEPDPQPYERRPESQLEPALMPAAIPGAIPAPVYVPDEPNDSNELYFPENYAPLKRTNVGNNQARSFFRELAQEKGLEQEQKPLYSNLKRLPMEAVDMPVFKRRPATTLEDDFNSNENNNIDESLLRNSLKPFEEEAMIAANSYPHRNKHQKSEKVFSEGGLIMVPEEQQDIKIEYEKERRKEKARKLLENMLGFTRHERLDVKKPGPMLGPPPSVKEDLKRVFNKTENKEHLPAHIKGSTDAHKKKKVVTEHSDEDHAPHTVDTEYAHVFVKNQIDSWTDGARIMTELANILHMQGYFNFLTVQPHEVSFRVDSNNPERKNASEIARAINENRGVKNNILRRLGFTVVRAGVGDKTKRDDDSGVSAARIELTEQGPDVTHIMAYMFAGAGAAAVIVIFVTLILIKRHDRKRDKLGGLQSGVAGAECCSKDYQDLCRARMAGKGNTTEPVPSGRITSLTKENDRPPSSRSSTSSWSEEPALTNMDISTGHMVLSYMEDHLRNKGRLQREWEALCRYEAEPSARDAALQPQCSNLNRPGAPLPYDHSRVVLNHLANAEGLDYVNASTITDHDPRAPAYVAAQGPLPTALAHFWQMIWEQGAVVIVALCRLQENGEIACARYWPEEGAEVYHIYEVHLVSEHIWCDDYLVRSFYLKNLRTSETRTVTQFHFLSWPQNGVPVQAKALLDFRRKVNKSYRGRSCPIVVHDSTGAGRTGAYILLDLVLGRMNKGAREIDIAATLEHLRDQRAGLVATRQQFEFVLMAVAEEVHAILKALPANQSGEKKEIESGTQPRETGTLKEEGEEVTSDSTINATTTITKDPEEPPKGKSDKTETAAKPTPAKSSKTEAKKK